MTAVRAHLEVPSQLVPSLLHIGAQKVRVTIANHTAKSFGPAEVRVAIPGVSVEPARIEAPIVNPGKEWSLSIAFPLERLDRMRLVQEQYRDDGLRCTLEVSLDEGRNIGAQDISLLPPSAWKYDCHPEALAAFVQRESLAVTRVSQAARPFLNDLLGHTSFADALDLSLAKYPSRTEGVICAFYRALGESYGIHYEWEPRTYPVKWQRVRFHDQVLAVNEGTCIDLALFFMACLERWHLDPVLVLLRMADNRQHALVGCWRNVNCAKQAVLRDGAAFDAWLPPPLGSGELLLFDPTGSTVERRWPFSKACEVALCSFREARMVWTLNLARCRVRLGKRKAIAPLPFGQGPTFSPEAWAVVRCAERRAQVLRFDVVERAHLLYALLASAEELTRELFGDNALKLKQRTEERLKKKSPGKDRRTIWPTRSFQRALERAGHLADQHGSGVIGTVQLLHAVLEDPGDTTGRILDEFGVDRDALVRKLIDIAFQDPQRASYLDFKSSYASEKT